MRQILCLILALAVNFGYGATLMKRISTSHPVPLVIDKIKQILNEKKIKLFTLFDHAAEAEQVNLNLNPTQVIVFGDPKVGTLLMQEDPAVALELPLKMLVWQEDGQTWIGYQPPSNLGKTYRLEQHQPILEKMDLLLAAIAETAAK
jgi:uncharacterized protein (DUF302 family)